jgi:hypothetical protein
VPLGDTLGLFVAAYALADKFDMTIISNPSAMDNPDELAHRFTEVLDELVELSSKRTTAPN